MSVEFQTVALVGPVAAFPTTPQFVGSAKGSIAFALYTAGDIEVSLDGTNVHARLLSGVIPAVTFEANNYRNAWFRTATVGAISIGVGIESTGLR